MKHVDLASVDSIKEKLTTLSQVLDVFRKIRLGKLANMNPCLTHLDVLSKNHVITLMGKTQFFMVFIDHTTHPPILGKNLNQAMDGMHGHAANRALNQMRVTSKSAELVLFTIRTFIKYGSLLDLMYLYKKSEKLRTEINWLKDGSDLPTTLSLLKKCGPVIDEHYLSNA